MVLPGLGFLTGLCKPLEAVRRHRLQQPVAIGADGN